MSRVSISLSRNDWGQIVEGLKARRASWEVTARDISKGKRSSEAIEERRNADDARTVVATYDRLIGELPAQLRT